MVHTGGVVLVDVGVDDKDELETASLGAEVDEDKFEAEFPGAMRVGEGVRPIAGASKVLALVELLTVEILGASTTSTAGAGAATRRPAPAPSCGMKLEVSDVGVVEAFSSSFSSLSE
jgi:hypothetical protein